MHRVRHLRVTKCQPHCWMSLKIACLRYPFCILFYFWSLSNFLSFHAYFYPQFCVVLFYPFFTLFSLFLLFRQPVFSFTICVSSQCICLSPSYASPSSAAPNLLSRAHAPLKPATHYPCCLVLHEPLSEHDWVRRTEVTHSWEKKTPHFFAVRTPRLLFNILLLPKHAADAESAHIPHVCFSLCTVLNLLSNAHFLSCDSDMQIPLERSFALF